MFPDRVIHLQPRNMKSQDVMWKDGEPEKRQLPEKLIMRITYGQLSMACKHMAKKNYKEYSILYVFNIVAVNVHLDIVAININIYLSILNYVNINLCVGSVFSIFK